MALSKYLKIVKEEEIARRYFITNSFDGSLTILGIVFAIYLTRQHSASLVIISALGAAVAICISGIWGTYAIERAERLRSLKELEMHLLRDLDETEVEKNVNITIILVALVNGLSPLIVSLVIISPFFAAQLGLVGIDLAFYFSFVLTGITLFSLGMIIGAIGKENAVKSGLKVVLAGITVAGIMYVLQCLKVL